MVAAHYFDGRHSRRHEVRLSSACALLRVEGDFGSRVEPWSRVEVSEPMGDAPRTLRFEDGACCEVADREGLVALLAGAGLRDSPVVMAQRRWGWVGAAVLGLLVVAVAGYVYLLPWLGGVLAPAVPETVVVALSERTLASLDEHVLRPSRVPPARQQALAERLAGLDRRQGPLPSHRLHFRAAPRLGPNAFALPNGDLVIFDELVVLSADDDDILAVMAHELGHVRYRHGLRQMIQGAVVSFVAGVWFGDVSSIAAGLGALVLQSNYSRDFEQEADAYAGRLLLADGGGVEGLVRMLERIEARHAKRGGDSPSLLDKLLGTHPDLAARTTALRALAGR